MEKKTVFGIIMQAALIAVFVFFALACATTYDFTKTKASLNSLQGQYISVALQKYGPPSYITDDGQGGKIYVWNDNMGTSTSGSSSTGYNSYLGTYNTYSGSSTQTNYCEKDVYVNADGIIYNWRAKGNRCD